MVSVAPTREGVWRRTRVSIPSGATCRPQTGGARDYAAEAQTIRLTSPPHDGRRAGEPDAQLCKRWLQHIFDRHAVCERCVGFKTAARETRGRHSNRASSDYGGRAA